MIAAGQPAGVAHALLDHGPLAVVGDDEAVQVEVEAVLHGGTVDLGDQPARLRQGGAVETDAFADCRQLVRRPPRMAAATAADMDAELVRQRCQPPLEGAQDAGGDPRGVPVHSHDGAEGLEPERVGEAAQELVAAVVVDDGLRP